VAFQIEYSQVAECDLEQILCRIKRHNLDAARRFASALDSQLELISQFPEMGRIVP
jgi:plasmid stabilization system protein ParE